MANFDPTEIKVLREKARINQAVVAEWINTSRSNYTKKETGKVPFTAEEYVTILNKIKGLSGGLPEVEPSSIPVRSPMQRPIPVISWVQAGAFAEASDLWSEGVSGEGDPVFTSKKVGPHAFALQVKGDSTEPRYLAGDVIVVDPELECDTGCPCVAKLNDDVTFKIFYKNAVEIRLRALNPKYPDIVIPMGGQVDFKVIGRVVDMIPKL